jgi:hypothetical protein
VTGRVDVLNAGLSPDPAELYAVHVCDAVDRSLTGHDGCAYVSPPQPREQALMLVALLLGSAAAPAAGVHGWTRAVAGGRRTITLTAILASDGAGVHGAWAAPGTP